MAWNLRISTALHQGDRQHMEDQYTIHYECNKKTGQFHYAYFGIFDGHGGADASKFVKKHLHLNITNNIKFHSTDPEDVMAAIKEGYLKTHEDMWPHLGEWPKTSTGLPSTAGTTASIVIIKDNRIFTGHAGDSGIILGELDENTHTFNPVNLTVDHKPESPAERRRIEYMGGLVRTKAEVHRVVWKRPRFLGPVKAQTDDIPFLAVARSLGDLWSYNINSKNYAISPEPDVDYVELKPTHKCLVLGTDGIWNMMDSNTVISLMESTEKRLFRDMIYRRKHWSSSAAFKDETNPCYHHAATLVNATIRKWKVRGLRADNTSALVVMIDHPGVPLFQILSNISTQTQSDEQNIPYCAQKHLQKNYESLTGTEGYILSMCGSYNQYEKDEFRDKYELHHGKPLLRYGIPREAPEHTATSSLTMYDTIVHKVLTPVKTPLERSRSLGFLRRSQSGKELKKFRPPSGILCPQSSPVTMKETSKSESSGLNEIPVFSLNHFSNTNTGQQSSSAQKIKEKEDSQASPMEAGTSAETNSTNSSEPDSTTEPANQSSKTHSSTNQKPEVVFSTNQKPNVGCTTNQNVEVDSSTNQDAEERLSTNQKSDLDSTTNQLEDQSLKSTSPKPDCEMTVNMESNGDILTNQQPLSDCSSNQISSTSNYPTCSNSQPKRAISLASRLVKSIKSDLIRHRKVNLQPSPVKKRKQPVTVTFSSIKRRPASDSMLSKSPTPNGMNLRSQTTTPAAS